MKANREKVSEIRKREWDTWEAKREKRVNRFLERMARLAGGNVKEKKSSDRFCRWGSVSWLPFEIFATIIILEAKRRRKRARKKGRRQRWTYKGEHIPLSEGSEGIWTTNLFFRRSGKSTLVIQRSRGSTLPRFLRSNLLDDFFFRVSSSRQPLGSAPFWKSEDFPSGRGGLTSTTIDKPG